jgi:hypothetical protein
VRREGGVLQNGGDEVEAGGGIGHGSRSHEREDSVPITKTGPSCEAPLVDHD